MTSQDFLKGYLSRLEKEIPVLTQEPEVLFELINEYRKQIDSSALEQDSFLESLDMFEDALDSKVLDSK